jgi:hypothetical protein
MVRLPAELIHIIFDYLEDLLDCVCLSVTCMYLLDAGSSHIRICALKEIESWAGDRILCTGSYSDADDEPLVFLPMKIAPTNSGFLERRV